MRGVVVYGEQLRAVLQSSIIRVTVSVRESGPGGPGLGTTRLVDRGHPLGSTPTATATERNL